MIFGISALLILLLIFLGVSVPLCFLGGAIFCALFSGLSTGAFATNAYYALDSVSMLAVPLFMLAGVLIEKSGIARVLIDLANRMLYRVKGGMTATIPVVSCFFGALCGSSLATASTLTSMMTPELTKRGWDKRYVAALIAVSSPFGYMIPPNVNAIIFSSVTSASVGALFLATIIPGILWAGLYLAINRAIYKKWYHPELAEEGLKGLSEEEVSRQAQKKVSFLRVIRAAIPAFIMPVITLGGIYGGVFTPSEAGAVGCLYAAICGVAIYRSFKVRDLPDIFASSAFNVATLLIMFPMTMIFTKIMVRNRIPDLVAEVLLGITESPILLILIFNIVLFVIGFFLDANVILLSIVPLLSPTAAAIGMSSVQLGVIVFVSLGIGSITPPMAMCLFTCAKVTGIPVEDMVKPAIPFLLFGALPIMLLVSFVPALSEWLPGLFYVIQ